MRKKFERLVGMTAAAALLLGMIPGIGAFATDSEAENLLPGENVAQSDDIVEVAEDNAYAVSVTEGDTAEEQNGTTAGEADTTPPVITLIGATEMYIVTGGSYTEPGYAAEDNVDGDLTESVVVGGDTVDTAVAGTYIITYNVSDAAGNAAEEKTRTVTVGPDITPPVITLKGKTSVSVTVGDLYTEPGYTATDDVDGNLTESVVVGGDTVNVAVAGTYTITYTVSDAAGNKASATRTVTVKELDYTTNFCINTNITTQEPKTFSAGGTCRSMFDGDDTTFCRSWAYGGAGCTGEYVMKFKSGKVSFNRLVVINGNPGRSFSLSLQIRDSVNDPWIDVLDRVAVPSDSDKTTTVDFDAVSSKYVRFYIDNVQLPADNFNIREIQLWMDEGHYKTGKDLKTLNVPSKTGVDLTLPTAGRCGTAIEWTSSNPALLDATGHVVARPENAEGEQTVRLTANVTYGQTTQTAEFDVIVTPKNIAEDASLSGIENAAKLNDADYTTVVNLTDGCEVEAAFDSKEFLSKAEFALVGTDKPSSIEVLAWDGNDYVSLGDQTPTATDNGLMLTFPAGEYEKLKFRFNGSASAAEMLLGMTDDDAVDYLAERLTISDEKLDQITKDLILKSRGEQEQLVTWSSDNTAVVHDNGSVIRPEQDTNVRITAVITKGNSSKTVYFDITVLKKTSGGGFSGAGGGSGAGGRGNSGSQIIAPIATPVVSPTEVPEETIKPSTAINDMDASHWAYEYVEKLKNAGIVSGDENGNFEPERTITRAEYVKLLVTAFGLAGEADAFDDVAADAWYLPYVAAARANGIVLGDEKNHVRPDAEITRQDMAVLLGRTLEVKGLVPMPKREYTEFADSDAISEYAAPYIQAIYCGGIIDGTGDGAFEPQSLATRAQAAKVFAVALKED